MKIENFLIDGNCSIKDALTKIDNNSFGIIFSQTKSGEVYGVATDGDIRRSLIAGLGLDDKLDKCINKELNPECADVLELDSEGKRTGKAKQMFVYPSVLEEIK